MRSPLRGVVPIGLGVLAGVLIPVAIAIILSGRVVPCGPLSVAAEVLGRSSDWIPGCAGVLDYRRGRALLHEDPRRAVESFDVAIAKVPNWAPPQAGRGEALEVLGDFDAALDAYQRAAGLSASSDDYARLGNLAGRMGRVDQAVEALQQARPGFVQRLKDGGVTAVTTAVGCAVDVRAHGGSSWFACVPPIWSGFRHGWRAASERPAERMFTVLLENGRRDQALTVARDRGWTRPDADHCVPAGDAGIETETSLLLAVLVHPERADCALTAGTSFADAGLVRLSRFVLLDRAARGTETETRDRAKQFLRYRLPTHQVSALAESLNVTGYRLEHSYRRPDAAIAVYRRAIAHDRRFSWPLQNLAHVYLEQKQTALALEWIGKALEASPEHWNAWKTYGRTLYEAQRYGQAVAAFSRAVQMDPNDADGLAELGRSLYTAGRQDEGVKAMRAAVRMNPTFTDLRQWLEARAGRDARQAQTAAASVTTPARAAEPVRALDRARAAFDAGRYVEALTAARAATHAEPASAVAAVMRAHAAAHVGELAEAKMWHGRGAELAPDDPNRLYAAAMFAVQTGDYDEAIRHLDRLVSRHAVHARVLFAYAPTSIQSWVLRTNPALEQVVQTKIDVLLEKGDFEGARRLAREHGIVPANGGYCDEIRRRGGKGEREELFRVFRRAVLGEPDAADCISWFGRWLTDEGYLTLGRVMVGEGARLAASQGSKDLAANFLRVRVGPEIPKAAEHLFQIAKQRLQRDGDVDAASGVFEEVSRLAPRFARPHVYRARLAEEDGDVVNAIASLERATAADPDSWRAQRNLGMLLARQEQWSAAEAALQRTVKLFAEDLGARLALARVVYAQGRHGEFVQHARGALLVASRDGGRHDLRSVTEFLQKLDRWGPGPALPPAPDPAPPIGWNDD